ncbi:MAG: DUF177 domain-containing protein [Deltaproteobacteria bacterium]|nr:DUF177 domain-containing protein [Deltaproteobacteria bacterium]
MIIDLRTILHSPQDFKFTFESDWWENEEADDQIQGLDGPLKVQLRISRSGRKYILEGHLFGWFRLRCARCLEICNYKLDTEFALYLLHQPSEAVSEIELIEEDMSVDFITDDEINLYDIVREQVYLSFPIKFLCREDCCGLCPVCGENLNKVACECQQKSGHPGFSKLKNLRTKGV